MAQKRQGLRLTLPGAPNTPHTFPGIPGFYFASSPTPVGKDGELDLDTARELAAKGIPREVDGKTVYDKVDLKLVEIPSGEVKKAEELASEAILEARKGLLAERKLAAADSGHVGQTSAARINSEEK